MGDVQDIASQLGLDSSYRKEKIPTLSIRNIRILDQVRNRDYEDAIKAYIKTEADKKKAQAKSNSDKKSNKAGRE